VVLQFHGVDCGCCASKIFNSLSSVPDVRGLRTSPILLQAEFDLNTNRTSITDLIDRVQNATGYNCEQVTKNWQDIEAIVLDKFADSLGHTFPTGVKEVVSVAKNIVSIRYDAEAVGVRDLLDNAFGIPLRLAPARFRNEAASRLRKSASLTLVSSALTIPILVLSWAPLPPHSIAYGSVSLALATVIQVVVAGQIYVLAIRSLVFARMIDLNLLVVLSTTAAYVLSVVSFIYEIHGVDIGVGLFFETSALLVTLIMVGRVATAYACHRAMKSASIRSLQPTTVNVVDSSGSSKSAGKELDIRLLQHGDVFTVETDSPIVTDGKVISNLAYVDESMITGESCWVEKQTGSSVIAGSVNRSATLVVEVTRLPGSNTIDEIAAMVDKVNFSKPKVQELADQFATYFVPVIGVIALLTFCIWSLVGKMIQHHATRRALINAMLYAITVLVVSCPCVIGLAVPMVMVIACSVAAKRGVVVKSAGALEVARKVTHAVFDKTGTLTESHLAVSVEKYLAQPASFSLSLALGLTASSKHPVAATVARHAEARGVEPAFIESVENVVGKGATGIFNGEIVRIGSAGWLGVEDHSAVKPIMSEGHTVSCVTKGCELIAIFGLSASLRADAIATVSRLMQEGIEVCILSGDNHGAVQQAAHALKIPLRNTRSQYSPAEKQQYIKDLMGRPKTAVLFCGDGTNDSAALAQADVGVGLSTEGGGAEMAADVVLMRPSLGLILTLVDFSRDASRRVIFNFVWSAVYNLVAFLFAAGAFVNARLPPAYAGLGEVVSVVPVVLVALHMKWKR
jgi:Cu2+-exporting ATPase